MCVCVFIFQQPNIDGPADMGRMAENFEVNVGRRSREEEHESRSGSDNMDGGSGDDQDAADKPPRKKRYHRHTPQQIQELESYDLSLLFFFFKF
jgi:homeobox-leucine zipper protein